MDVNLFDQMDWYFMQKKLFNVARFIASFVIDVKLINDHMIVKKSGGICNAWRDRKCTKWMLKIMCFNYHLIFICIGFIDEVMEVVCEKWNWVFRTLICHLGETLNQWITKGWLMSQQQQKGTKRGKHFSKLNLEYFAYQLNIKWNGKCMKIIKNPTSIYL